MAETFQTHSPYSVRFETVFPIIGKGRNWSIGEPNRKMIDAVNNAHFADKEVVVFTAKPERDFPILRMCLDDHGILFDTIERRPLRKSKKNAPVI